ncbi:MAG TPA: hypothetical protein VGP93_05020 [Polyangiaceae bacterium]|jgi:hypothetical protein|nr:hypothetical protein [Polyangiaceae bacterium]
MAELRKAKKKRVNRQRKERRFKGEQHQASRLAIGAGIAGGLALGAGVYAEWIRVTPLQQAPFMLAGGAFTLGAALVFGDVRTSPVRVGDLGIAHEKGNEIVRVPWCDIDRVTVEGGKLEIKSKMASFALPLSTHKKAVAWILAEGTRRVPEIMDVKRDAIGGLPEPADGDGELVPALAPQVAGRRCAKTGKSIAFERDARLCPRCAQVYHHSGVPKKCVTCKAELGDKAIAL